MFNSNQPIGLFDSGIGGLTVMQELMHLLPYEEFIYLGDTARNPYGNKSAETILRYSLENANFLVKKNNIKFLVVACNTSSAYAIPFLREQFDIPIIGVIEAGARGAIASTHNTHVALLATQATIDSLAYQSLLAQLNPQVHVYPLACPLFVPLVEEQWIDHPVTTLIVQHYLQRLPVEKIDTLIMGCTHYPLLSKVIQKELSNQITLINPAINCALEVKKILEQTNQQAIKRVVCHQYYVSDAPQKFYISAKQVFGHHVITPEKVTLIV